MRSRCYAHLSGSAQHRTWKFWKTIITTIHTTECDVHQHLSYKRSLRWLQRTWSSDWGFDNIKWKPQRTVRNRPWTKISGHLCKHCQYQWKYLWDWGFENWKWKPQRVVRRRSRTEPSYYYCKHYTPRRHQYLCRIEYCRYHFKLWAYHFKWGWHRGDPWQIWYLLRWLLINIWSILWWMGRRHAWKVAIVG